MARYTKTSIPENMPPHKAKRATLDKTGKSKTRGTPRTPPVPDSTDHTHKAVLGRLLSVRVIEEGTPHPPLGLKIRTGWIAEPVIFVQGSILLLHTHFMMGDDG